MITMDLMEVMVDTTKIMFAYLADSVNKTLKEVHIHLFFEFYLK